MTPTDQAIFLFTLIGVLTLLANLGVAIIKIFEFFQRKPSIDQEFATKREVTELREEYRREMKSFVETNAKLGEKIDGLSAALNTSTNDIFRAIGQLEGRTK